MVAVRVAQNKAVEPASQDAFLTAPLAPQILVLFPNTPWDCHRTADQARGGARGVNGAAVL